MFFMTESGNPFDYMGNMWYALLVIAVLCVVLLVVLKPIHSWWTAKKTRSLIDESGQPSGSDRTEPVDSGDDEEEPKP